MYNKKKERLYITELIENPPVVYPMYYIVSKSMKENELLHQSLIATHMSDFGYYQNPKNASELFNSFNRGVFPIYKEQYVVGNFGGKLMYLESAGWKGMVVNEAVFEMTNWLI
jgi:hypothetical protein